MTMILPQFSAPQMVELARILIAEDEKNYKRDRDIELVRNRIILRSPNGTRYALVVDNAGALSTVAA
jgi:hypothetical protein